MVDPSIIGQVCRAKRVELGMKVKELSDENISTGTISNIENGLPSVSTEKVQYLLSKLGLSLDEIEFYNDTKNRELKKLKLRLDAIESIMDSQPHVALQSLKSLSLDRNHLYSPLLEMLKGKSCVRIAKDKTKCDHWRKAEVHFHESIRLSDSIDDDLLNIKAASYNELAIISSLRNDYNSAINFCRQGIKCFNESGKRIDYIYYLQFNLVHFLDKIGSTESQILLDKLFTQLDQIESQEIKIQLYEHKSRQLLKLGLFDQAKKYASEGIKLGRFSGNIKPSIFLYLWNSLGEAYLGLNQFDESEICFKSTFDLDLADRAELFVISYKNLASLYVKQEKFDLVREMVDKALEIDQNCIEALVFLGDCLIEKNDFEKAIKPLYESLSLSDNELLKIEILQKLAYCYDKTGNKKKLSDVLIERYRLEMKVKPS